MRYGHKVLLVGAVKPALGVPVEDGLAEGETDALDGMDVPTVAVAQDDLLLEPALFAGQAEGVLDLDVGRAEQAEVEAAVEANLLSPSDRSRAVHSRKRTRLVLTTEPAEPLIRSAPPVNPHSPFGVSARS